MDLRSLPKARLDFVEPMRLLLVQKLPSGAHWRYESKLDGYRVLVI
jgi:ATP-dependent DNA ligase